MGKVWHLVKGIEMYLGIVQDGMGGCVCVCVCVCVSKASEILSKIGTEIALCTQELWLTYAHIVATSSANYLEAFVLW